MLVPTNRLRPIEPGLSVVTMTLFHLPGHGIYQLIGQCADTANTYPDSAIFTGAPDGDARQFSAISETGVSTSSRP